jgi:hypothetical protein
LKALYLSAITFTTTGYGDLHPFGWGRLVAGIEVFLGSLSIALLIVCVVRKFSR